MGRKLVLAPRRLKFSHNQSSHEIERVPEQSSLIILLCIFMKNRETQHQTLHFLSSLTLVLGPLYSIIITSICHSSCPNIISVYQVTSLCTMSDAFSRSPNTKCNCYFLTSNFSLSFLNYYISSASTCNKFYCICGSFLHNLNLRG